MLASSEKSTLLISRVLLRPGCELLFISWQGRLNAAVAKADGFISLEFTAPAKEREEWLVVQRFHTSEQASAWQQSPTYRELYEQLLAMAPVDGIKEDSSEESTIQQSITDVFVTEVSPENEDDYKAWTARIHEAEAKFPGFQGVYVQSPGPGSRNWITLLQFDTADNLDRWLESKERKKILDESSSLIKALDAHRIISPYAGWFANVAKKGEIPPAWKQSMIVLLVLFPIVMLEMRYLSPLLSGFNLSLATFIGNAISVSLIAFPCAPAAAFLLRWWLNPKGKYKEWAGKLGTLLVCGLYLLEILFFWVF